MLYYQNDQVTIYNDSVLTIDSIPARSVDLIVTSPPYNVSIDYNSHDDTGSYDDYLGFSEQWMRRCFEWLKDDGRFCLNIPLDKNKGGQKSVGADFIQIAKSIGYQYHATIIWNEGNISRRTAWGSWMSASAPFVIAPVELIVVLYKRQWKKISGTRQNDVTRAEFLEWTNGVWTFNGESKKRIGHPAPFPIELPRRCVKMFSYVGDTVLDPFLGSGTTLIACLQNNRKGIGIELDEQYSALAQKRLEVAGIQQLKLLVEE